MHIPKRLVLISLKNFLVLDSTSSGKTRTPLLLCRHLAVRPAHHYYCIAI